MKVGTGITGSTLSAGQVIVGGWLGGVPANVRRAEETGYDYVTCGEQNHDSMLTMTMAAVHSERPELQTSVTIAFPRSPFVLAMEAWDIQHLSKGRFVLGLGSQVSAHNERRFSTPWTAAPAGRMRDYVRCLHAVWHAFQTGESPGFISKNYQFTLLTPHFNPGPIEYPRPKVFLAVVGDAMARVAGEVADGVSPHGFTTEKYMREVTLPNVKVGLERAQRTWEDIEISGGGFTVYGEDQAELEQRAERFRQTIAYYGSTPAYQAVWRLHGWGDLGSQLHALSRQQRWDDMTALISDEVLHTFVQSSTYDNLPIFLRQHKGYADRVNIGLPNSTPAERERSADLIRQINRIQPDRSDISRPGAEVTAATGQEPD
jgi:probable F420-dependent oxidoreductase